VLAALKTRDYRLLWIGQTISLLGDQFHLIALPWLVLQLTGSAVQLGLVLAVAGLARAAFMLPGGAFADRQSPRSIMIGVNALRLVWTGLLAWAVLGGWVEMWMVYASALVLGAAGGLFEPASSAAVPRLVPGEHLESGNALVQMGDWAASFLGPAAAGTLIGLLGASEVAGERVASLAGVGTAFAFDALTFAASIVTLVVMSILPPAERDEVTRPVQDIVEGFRYAWRRSAFRWILILIALANFLMVGPLLVGIPVLAQERLPEGAAALGIVLSAYALGNLGGLLLAGSVKNPRGEVIGAVTIALFGLFGLGLGSFAFVSSTWVAAPIMTVMGVGNGFIGITMITAVQRMTPESMLGRVMSLVMLAMFAITPLSQAISGAIVETSFGALYVSAAVGMFVVAGLAASRPEVRRFGEVGMDLEASPSAQVAPEPAFEG
jgi:MFS family permease